MGVDDLVRAVEAHRRHLAPLVDELGSCPQPSFRAIARLLGENGDRLDRLCADLGAHAARNDRADR